VVPGTGEAGVATIEVLDDRDGVENDEPAHLIGMVAREPEGHERTAVVTDDVIGRMSEPLHQ
jgi:hypothetical protein